MKQQVLLDLAKFIDLFYMIIDCDWAQIVSRAWNARDRL